MLITAVAVVSVLINGTTAWRLVAATRRGRPLDRWVAARAILVGLGIGASLSIVI